ncbi:MAG: ribosome-recycling factor [Parcubacteria group bacterium]
MDPLKEVSQKMDEIIAQVKDEFSRIRGNRPTTRLIEQIKVSYMGCESQINHVATLGIQPPRDIIVSPWDKSVIQNIVKAVEEEGLGLGVSNDGAVIRFTLPELTGERKAELVKLIKSIAEDNRIKMRAARDKSVKELNSLPEDQKFKGKENLQKLVDDFNERIDKLLEEKTAELEA